MFGNALMGMSIGMSGDNQNNMAAAFLRGQEMRKLIQQQQAEEQMRQQMRQQMQQQQQTNQGGQQQGGLLQVLSRLFGGR